VKPVDRDVKPVLLLPQVALVVFFELEFDTLVHQQVASLCLHKKYFSNGSSIITHKQFNKKKAACLSV
jgi:hypothetical protein